MTSNVDALKYNAENVFGLSFIGPRHRRHVEGTIHCSNSSRVINLSKLLRKLNWFDFVRLIAVTKEVEVARVDEEYK